MARKKWVSLGDIYSGGDTYVVYASSNTVKKNSDTIYDDYEHSETHLSVSNRGSSSTSGKTSTSNNKDSYGHTKGDAFAIAEKAVKGKLKSPSTAKFCSVTEATIGCSGNTWVVRGWVDTSTPTGKLMLTMIAAINEFERENLLERQREGIAIAKAAGKLKGGQVKRIDDKTFCAAYDRYQHRELNKTQLAAELKISRPTLDKMLKDKGLA